MTNESLNYYDKEERTDPTLKKENISKG